MPKKSRSTMPLAPSSASKPAVRVWAWDKSLEAGAMAKTEKSAHSSFISVYCGTSEYQVSQRASIVIQSMPNHLRGHGFCVSIVDTETGQTLLLPGTEARVDISGGWPVITVSDA